MKENAVVEEKTKILGVEREIEEMMAAGVHRGHSKSRRHPAMAPYIWGTRNTIEIIDLAKTKEKLATALEFLKELAKRNGLLLIVGTQPAAKHLVENLASEFGYPAVTERWIGGTLTNFKVISKRIERMEEIEKNKASGELEKFTKKEQLRIDEELERLRRAFGGMRVMKRLPDALFLVSLVRETTALREAKRLGIPVVAIADTNSDPREADYPIPANDDARPALEYMFVRIKQTIREGLAQAAEQVVAEAVLNADIPNKGQAASGVSNIKTADL